MNDSTQNASLHGSEAKDDVNPMRKIILIVGAAIVVFLAFTAFSVHKSLQSNGQLTDISALYFPVLERADANIVTLGKMEELYMQAVMTAESDQIEEANDQYAKADKVFAEIATLYPARADDIAKLRTDFKNYKELATKTAEGMIAKEPESSPVAMNKALAELKQKVKDFRQSSYDNFLTTLQETKSASQLNLYMGLAIGIMNLIFMGVLVFFIRNTVKMTAVIAEQNATLELRVAERTAQLSQKTNDINAMLNNMSLGVCTVVPGNRLHPEYSAYMRTIFETDDLADKGVLETLFANSTLGVDTKDQVDVALGAIVGEDAMMFDFNGHLLANEMQIKGGDGKTKILQMDWSPIKNEDDVTDKVLLIVQDVTHLRELELEAASQKEELDIISQILKISIGKFNDFVDSAQKYVADNRQLIEGAAGRDTEVIAALFRNMHTIKGNARTFEFTGITNAAHAAEQEYDRLRKDAQAEWEPAKLLEELNTVALALEKYVEVNEDKLGRKGRASDLLTTRGVFVSMEEIAVIKSLTAEAAQGGSGAGLAALQKTVDQLGLIPLQRLVSGSVDSISSLAKELNKPTPRVEIINGEVAFNNALAQPLKSSLMHIVRNSLDHGVEGPEERQRAGKPAEGQLRFQCERGEAAVELRISDDGRGLALHKLYEKGLAVGVFQEGETPSHTQVAEIIFHSGLSTAETVTQVSGRGVGMDAVRAYLAEQGATVRIELKNPGTDFSFTPFELVICMPLSACYH